MPSVRDAGDAALVLEFGDVIDPDIARRVARLDGLVRRLHDEGELPGLVEAVPTFRSLALLLDPRVTDPASVARRVLEGWSDRDDRSTGPAPDPSGGTGASDASPVRRWTLPVRYGGAQGPDLDDVAARTGLSADEVVRLHATTEVGVYMLGFLPGYAFLGDTHARLHLPRRAEPRTRVPGGSVAIATRLTGVYPVDCPGGWHLVGHCPVPMFDAAATPPVLLAPGDRVRFRACTADEHADLVDAVGHGRFDAASLLETAPAAVRPARAP